VSAHPNQLTAPDVVSVTFSGRAYSMHPATGVPVVRCGNALTASRGSQLWDVLLRLSPPTRSGHYWIVDLDLDEPVTLLDCHLAGPLGYADGGSISGTFTTTSPCPLRLELDRLLR